MKAKRIRYENGHPIYATHIVEQPWGDYSNDEHALWEKLVSSQDKLLMPRADPTFIEGRKSLHLDTHKLPKFSDLDNILYNKVGWHVVAIEGLLPTPRFMELLSQRNFPTTWWLRNEDEQGYLPEPDFFHDVYGHLPMLTNRSFADFTQAYGEIGYKVSISKKISQDQKEKILSSLASTYWFSVEFGLGGTVENPKILGAGIASSSNETLHSVDTGLSNVSRELFDALKVENTSYEIDKMQNKYFIISDFSQWINDCLERFDYWENQIK